MVSSKSSLLCCTLACIIGLGSAELTDIPHSLWNTQEALPAARERVIYRRDPNGDFLDLKRHRGDRPVSRTDDRLGSSHSSILVKYLTFDDFWWEEDFPNATYTSDWDGYMQFNHLNVVFASEAQEEGFIDSRDMDCAASKPNAVVNYPTNITTPSVIRSNATAMNAAGFSEFFDVVGWSWKPLGPTPVYPVMNIEAYRIDKEGDQYEFVSDFGEIWGSRGDDFYEPDTLIPEDIFYREWGHGVNWVEFTSKMYDENFETVPGPVPNFCIDNVLLVFHKLGHEEHKTDL